MARRLEALPMDKALELLGNLSDSDVSDLSDDSGDEEDVTYQYVTDQAEDEEPDTDRPELTRSQRKLLEADFIQQPESSAGPYVVLDRRHNTQAEWSARPQPTRRRRDPANILTQRDGVQGVARAVTSEADAFKLFITDDIIKSITERTNKKLAEEWERLQAAPGNSKLEKSAYLYQSASHTEMCAFLGLCLLRGFYNRLTLQELFDPATGPAIFKATMGGRWFAMLLKNLTFDERCTRDERRQGDKFCPMREVFQEVDQNLRKHYRPTECLTLDESLLKVPGPLPLQALPTK